MDDLNKLSELEVKVGPKSLATGRCVISRMYLENGHKLLHVLPYAISPYPAERHRFCSHLPCSLYSQPGLKIRCTECEWSYYCSPKCCERDRRKHGYICGGLKQLSKWPERDRWDVHYASIVRTMLLVLAQRGIETTVTPRQDEDDGIRSFYLKRLAETSMPHRADPPPPSLPRRKETLFRPTFAHVLEMQSRMREWSVDYATEWITYQFAISKVFEQCIPDLMPHGWEFMEILDLASKLEDNLFHCYEEDCVPAALLSMEGLQVLDVKPRKVPDNGKPVPKNPKKRYHQEEREHWDKTMKEMFERDVERKTPKRIGIGIYPHAAFFNHSCTPNVYSETMTAIDVTDIRAAQSPKPPFYQKLLGGCFASCFPRPKAKPLGRSRKAQPKPEHMAMVDKYQQKSRVIGCGRPLSFTVLHSTHPLPPGAVWDPIKKSPAGMCPPSYPLTITYGHPSVELNSRRDELQRERNIRCNCPHCWTNPDHTHQEFLQRMIYSNY